MTTITIPKKEYIRLKDQAKAYQKMAKSLFSAVLRDPISEVAEDFRATGLYKESFLNDLEDGLRKSSYLKIQVSK
jgi:hypothetical protein